MKENKIANALMTQTKETQMQNIIGQNDPRTGELVPVKSLKAVGTLLL